MTVRGVTNAMKGFFSAADDDSLTQGDYVAKWTEKTCTVLSGAKGMVSGTFTVLTLTKD